MKSMNIPVAGIIRVNNQSFHNLIMDRFRDAECNFIAGKTALAPASIAVGFGSAAPLVTDAKLVNEYVRKALATAYNRDGYHARMTAAFAVNDPPPAAGSTSIRFYEMGLFDKAPFGSPAFLNQDLESWSGGTPSVSGSPVAWTWDASGTPKAGTAAAEIYAGSASAIFSVTSGTPTFFQDITWAASYVSTEMIARCAIKVTSGGSARVFIDDGVDLSYSGYAGTAFALTSVNKILSGSATRLRVGVEATAGSAYVDWFSAMPRGNLLARAVIDVTKTTIQPLALVWEIYLQSQDEEGDMPYQSFAREEISAGTASAGSLTSATYAPVAGAAQQAFITVENYGVRYWSDGGTPSATSGHLGGSLDAIVLNDSTDIANFKYIGIGGTALLKVTYLR
jgi:hypothetical protein